jgi:Rps23 Pro-64 3,4-dihydroxylase Tpa1-like proline 4-hydroxylase
MQAWNMNNNTSRLVNEDVINNGDKLRQQFASAAPFRHVAIDDFLEPGFAKRLLNSFPAFDEKLAINENGEVGAKAVHEKIEKLGQDWRMLDKLVQSTEFRKLISSITNIQDLKFDPDYFGGGTHENLHGQGLNPHVDFNFHPITRQHRRLNLILYLSPQWRREWGGSIQLHRDPYKPPAEDDIVTITPAFNRCVIFETNEYSWHGFRRIALPEDMRDVSRKSFALYYYTDTRPAKELGAEHSTIYVEHHLPENFHAGMELTADQLQHVRNLLVSRDQHLKRLYENIKQLYTELNDQRGRIESIGVPAETGTDTEDTEEVTRLRNQLTGMQNRILEFETSTSWRVTSPLRALKRSLGKRH